MRVEAVSKANLEDFFTYCRAHRKAVDDSYLYEEDFAEFLLGEDNPTYLVMEKDEVIAAASLVIDDYHRRGRRARFRIFHSEKADQGIYQELLDALRPSIDSLDYVFVFVPEEDSQTANIIKRLGFFIERSSYMLIRDTSKQLAMPELPESLSLQMFRPGMDESHYVTVRNRGFENLLGSQTPLLEEQVSKMIKDQDHLPEGMLLLFDGDQAVGIVRGTDDEYEGEPIVCIGPLAIIPEYQGRGLGRYLLRAIIKSAAEMGYKRVYLSVNAENDGAKALYLKEGFTQEEAIHCYRFDCK